LDTEAGLRCSGCRTEFGVDREKGIYRLVSAKQSTLISKIDEDWTQHWEKSNTTFHAITSLIRRYLTAPLVYGGLKDLAQGSGKIFLEAGAGTSETSVLVDLSRHTSISMDISEAVLKRSVNSQLKLQGDLFNLPLQDGSVDVIFNIGVHEHYSNDQNAVILQEFMRVLRVGGRVVLFWPWYWAPLMILGRTINVVMTLVLGRKYELYPNQYWELRRFADGDRLMTQAGFGHVRHYLSTVDLFSMLVLEYEKRA
jgi:SAM-dependent methyltransferase